MISAKAASHTPTPFIKCRFCMNNDTYDHQHQCQLHGVSNFIVDAFNAYDKLKEFTEKVSRSACLQQRVGEGFDRKCICFACEADRVLYRGNAIRIKPSEEKPNE